MLKFFQYGFPNNLSFITIYKPHLECSVAANITITLWMQQIIIYILSVTKRSSTSNHTKFILILQQNYCKSQIMKCVFFNLEIYPYDKLKRLNIYPTSNHLPRHKDKNSCSLVFIKNCRKLGEACMKH